MPDSSPGATASLKLHQPDVSELAAKHETARAELLASILEAATLVAAYYNKLVAEGMTGESLTDCVMDMQSRMLDGDG